MMIFLCPVLQQSYPPIRTDWGGGGGGGCEGKLPVTGRKSFTWKLPGDFQQHFRLPGNGCKQTLPIFVFSRAFKTDFRRFEGWSPQSLPPCSRHLSTGMGCKRWGSRQIELGRTMIALKGVDAPSGVGIAFNWPLRRQSNLCADAEVLLSINRHIQ